MADVERELSQFLYHVTQEIITSGDFSDCNINRICGHYYDSSNYPDRDRLRRLVAELKRKLQIYQINDLARSSNHVQPINTDQFHRCSCQRSQEHYNPYPPEEKTTADKCVATTTDSSRAFFPTSLLVSDSTQYSEQQSCRTFSTATDFNNSTCTACHSTRDMREPKSEKRSPRSSEDSSTLIEQLILKHAAQDGENSSEILMRLAAGDRVLCESCHGKCPLHRCGQQLRDGAVPGSPPPVCSGRCNCGPTCGPAGYPGRQKNSECPLKQCGHDGHGSDRGGGSSGLLAPILRQEPPETPPVACCGTRKKKRSQQKVCKPKCNK